MAIRRGSRRMEAQTLENREGYQETGRRKTSAHKTTEREKNPALKRDSSMRKVEKGRGKNLRPEDTSGLKNERKKRPNWGTSILRKRGGNQSKPSIFSEKAGER